MRLVKHCHRLPREVGDTYPIPRNIQGQARLVSEQPDQRCPCTLQGVGLMTFKGPLQLKLFCNSMGPFSRSSLLRALPYIHSARSGLAGFKHKGCCPKSLGHCREHQWHRSQWWILVAAVLQEGYLGIKSEGIWQDCGKMSQEYLQAFPSYSCISHHCPTWNIRRTQGLQLLRAR